MPSIVDRLHPHVRAQFVAMPKERLRRIELECVRLLETPIKDLFETFDLEDARAALRLSVAASQLRVQDKKPADDSWHYMIQLVRELLEL